MGITGCAVHVHSLLPSDTVTGCITWQIVIGGHVKPIHTCQRFADLVCSCSYFEKNPTAGYCRAVVSGKVRKAQEKFPTLMIR